MWSSTKLKNELSSIISDYNVKQIDCNSYQLSVGNEAHVTPDDDNQNKYRSFNSDGVLEIPAGQYALIMTTESITMPQDVMGFISMRAGIKFKGLINVSGFHVDPGYTGKLIFGVYNAGPKAISIKQGDKIFLIWFSSLEDINDENKSASPCEAIPSKYINELNLPFTSPSVLNKKIDKHQADQQGLIEKIASISNLAWWLLGLTISSIITVGVLLLEVYMPMFDSMRADLLYLKSELERQSVELAQPINANLTINSTDLSETITALEAKQKMLVDEIEQLKSQTPVSK